MNEPNINQYNSEVIENKDVDVLKSAFNVYNREKDFLKDMVALLSTQDAKTLKLMRLALNPSKLNKKSKKTKTPEKFITYSKNIFIPVTNMCQNYCGYCTFKKDPKSNGAIILKDEKEVINQLKESEKYGCKEAMFALGEYADTVGEVKESLNKKGYDSMVDYIYYLSSETLEKTKLLPHTNMGILNYDEMKLLKEVNVSMGMMLENSSQRLMETETHENSPGKDPEKRLEVLENAGKLKIPYTTGILIGIGETLEERAKSLIDIRKIQDKYGHIQEIIIQNFRSKPGIPMENQNEPTVMEMIKTVSVAKLLFPDLSIQVPPNLNYETSQIFLLCGCDDWGGVSPITKDYVNPEAPWPEIEYLKRITSDCGFNLQERLAIYEKYMTKEYLNEDLLEKTLQLKNIL